MSGGYLEYIIPGIADGSVYAICALGLVITYKTSGVFNFAHGAVAAAGAYAFYQFRIRNHMAWPLAMILALLLVGLVGGYLLERMTAALADVPTVNVVVATVGVLVLLQSLATAIYGARDIQFREYLPTGGFHVGRVIVSGGDIIITSFALLTAVGLYLFFGRSRLGAALSGVVDNPDLLSLQGFNPDAVRRIAWFVGSAFAGISGMLLAPKLFVSVNTLILVVITSFGAAAIGRFDSLLGTFFGGLLMGIAVDLTPKFLGNTTNVVLQGLPRNIPFLVLFATLLFVPASKFPDREKRAFKRFRPIKEYSPRVMGPALALSILAMAVWPLLTIHNIIDHAKVNQYSSMLGYMIIFASLALITWTSGQISLCHLAFAALGATTCGHMLGSGVPYPIALLIAGLIAIPAGLIVAVPANRLSGIYVAVATFGFGILLEQVFFPSYLMFGVVNRVRVPRPHILGIDFTSDRGFYYLALIVTVLCCASIIAVRRSRLGRLLRALSDSPVALDAHGANAKLTRILIFAFSAFLAGIGGAVIAGVPGEASGAAGGTFDFTVSLVFVAVLAFCGRRPLLSPFLAAFFYEVLKTLPGFDSETVIKYQGVAFGALAILVALGRSSFNFRPSPRMLARERRGPGAERLVAVRRGPIQPLRVAALATAPAVAAAVNGTAAEVAAPRTARPRVAKATKAVKAAKAPPRSGRPPGNVKALDLTKTERPRANGTAAPAKATRARTRTTAQTGARS